jgi:hypothetical protein
MLAIRNLQKAGAKVLLLFAAFSFVSCGTHKDNRLVSDPSEKDESTIPWNKQEKWETQGQGQLSQMSQERR